MVENPPFSSLWDDYDYFWYNSANYDDFHDNPINDDNNNDNHNSNYDNYDIKYNNYDINFDNYDINYDKHNKIIIIMMICVIKEIKAIIIYWKKSKKTVKSSVI